jgi:hypothetical protein
MEVTRPKQTDVRPIEMIEGNKVNCNQLFVFVYV